MRCEAMTAQAIDPEPVPLVRDHAGRLMVPGTRISLEILVAACKRGGVTRGDPRRLRERVVGGRVRDLLLLPAPPRRG